VLGLIAAGAIFWVLFQPEPGPLPDAPREAEVPSSNTTAPERSVDRQGAPLDPPETLPERRGPVTTYPSLDPNQLVDQKRSREPGVPLPSDELSLAEQLAQPPDPVKLIALETTLISGLPEERVAALGEIEGFIDHVTVQTILNHALPDPDPVVRTAAVQALMLSRNPAAIPALEEVADVDPEPEIREQATQAAEYLDHFAEEMENEQQ